MSSFQIARCIFPSIFLSSLSSTWKVFAPYFDFFFLRVFFLNLANILFIVSSSSLRVPLLSIFFRKLDLLSVSIWFTFEPLSWWGFSCSIKVSLCLSIFSIVYLFPVYFHSSFNSFCRWFFIILPRCLICFIFFIQLFLILIDTFLANKMLFFNTLHRGRLEESV